MPHTLHLDLPDFVDQQSLGHEGIVDRIAGQYRGTPALVVRLIEDAAGHPSVVDRFLQMAADLASFSEHLRRESPALPCVRVPEILFHGRDGRNNAVIVIALPQGGRFFRIEDSGSWSQEKALRLAVQFVETLRIANQRGIYCCALIPSTIYVGGSTAASANQSKAEVTLLSLGLTQIEAAYTRATGQPLTGLLEDDLAYRAPELRDDPTQLQEQGEVYSLAALLHFLILGRVRTRLTTVVKAGVHEDVSSLLLGMLRKNPLERPSLQQVQQRILEVLTKLADFEVKRTCWAMSECSLHEAFQFSTQQPGWLRVLSRNTSTAQRAQMEAVSSLLQQGSQPGVSPTLEIGEQTDQTPYIFSAKHGSQTLAEYVQKHGPLRGAALGIVEGIARTIRSLHRDNILYLGLCPENVVLQTQPDLPVVYERAKLPQCWLLQTEYTQTQRKTAGTKSRTLVEDSRSRPAAQHEPYLAPELYDPTSMVLERADVFSIGSLLCLLLTGQPPPLSTVELTGDLGIHPFLHDRLRRLINRLRARRPVDRPTPTEAVRSLIWLARLDDLLQGELLDGKYKIEHPLAQGGMNALFVVKDMQHMRHAVLKCPFPELTIAMDRVRQEVASTIEARRGNPAVVNIIQDGELDPEVPYILMEMIDGETLTERLRRQSPPLTTAEVIPFGITMADVMKEIHAKLVLHRDLKPDNIMIEKDPSTSTGERVRILDFGIARVMVEQYAERRRLTGVGSFMGTPDYMAPEQADAARATDKADVFSLGVILYELLGGPLPAVHPLQKVGPPALMKLLGEMIAILPAMRPTMAEVAVRLREIQKVKPVPWITWFGMTSLCLAVGLTVWNVSREPRPAQGPLPRDLAVAADLSHKPAVPHRPPDTASSVRDFGVPVPPPGPPAQRKPNPPDLKNRTKPAQGQTKNSTDSKPCKITIRCINGEGLTNEQKQFIATEADHLKLQVCGTKPLILTKSEWYFPSPATDETNRLIQVMEGYWNNNRLRAGFDKNKAAKKVIISCK